jgi:hypothetical protein
MGVLDVNFHHAGMHHRDHYTHGAYHRTVDDLRDRHHVGALRRTREALPQHEPEISQEPALLEVAYESSAQLREHPTSGLELQTKLRDLAYPRGRYDRCDVRNLLMHLEDRS